MSSKLSRIENRGSKVEDRESRVEDRVLRIENLESKIEDRVSGDFQLLSGVLPCGFGQLLCQNNPRSSYERCG